ncbi:FAD-dependent oxidoreductase [Limnoglobus roseus]|uniref:FAD-dependent oxidoreductase n=1 Tax=Limnoglobus roseus TaxID=2598579 RepID=A0A5C1AQR5_9BACT|nr:FAD-dependent oxidoreductase [Limnoglobus roseus]QEL20072.1 FAD-dependent oxidoreductase [Limnoglobus roseus]
MSSSTSSLWTPAASARTASALAGNDTCDVCVIGAGIAGLTTAYLLGREGKRVLVLDAKPEFAAGETEYTTAHLAWYLDDHFSHLVAVRGDAIAKTAASTHRNAIALIGDIVKREQIDCDYHAVSGHLFAAANGTDLLHEEAETLTRLELPFERTKLAFPNEKEVECLRFPDHARFHPIRYVLGLVAAVRQQGGVIYTDTVVEKVRGGRPCEVRTTKEHTVTAGAVVIATNNPFEGGTVLHTKVSAHLTYALAANVPSGSFADGLFWDTAAPYHYVRLQPGGPASDVDTLIVGGEDHKTGQAQDQATRWDRLTAWTRERFPNLGPVRHRWSGQVFETPDGLGLIGLAPWNGPNVFVITGDSGMGLTHGTLGAQLVTDLVANRVNESAAAYSPSRLMPGALLTRLGENLNMAAQYVDWVTGGDVKNPDHIPPGQGAVIRSGLTKLAVYKDDRGAVTKMSAVCPHMGAIVHWNAAESTWDCPCHGSRFSATGTCLHGPSVGDLKNVD